MTRIITDLRDMENILEGLWCAQTMTRPCDVSRIFDSVVTFHGKEYWQNKWSRAGNVVSFYHELDVSNRRKFIVYALECRDQANQQAHTQFDLELQKQT